MRTVWKYDLPGVTNALDLPRGAVVRHVAAQHNRLCLWAEVDPGQPPTRRTFAVVGTGHAIPPGDLQFLGSLLTDGGTFVFHIYEATS